MAKVAVVTGSNKGIGFAIVRGMCKEFQGDVYLTARDVQRGEKAVEELKKEGLHPKFHQLDTTNKESIVTLAKFLQNNYGGIDVLVNNAGMMFKRADGVPFSEQAVVTTKVNYTSVVDVCEALFPLLRPGARIVHVSSSLAISTFSKLSDERKNQFQNADTIEKVTSLIQEFVDSAQLDKHESQGWASNAYGTSKLGLIVTTEIQQAQFDNDVNRPDIIVNCCCPGFVKTDMTNQKGFLTPDQGADTPLYLALLPPHVASPKGKYCQKREVQDWRI